MVRKRGRVRGWRRHGALGGVLLGLGLLGSGAAGEDGAAAVAPPRTRAAVPVATVRVTVKVGRTRTPIHPGIYGYAQADREVVEAAGLRLSRWGGNPSTRYNWRLGNAWNAARDWEFRNTDYGAAAESTAHERAALLCRDTGMRWLLTVPTIGWVAKDTTSRSSRERGADPKETSVPAPPEFIAAWIADLVAKGLAPDYVAMDNEPDLWGHTHSDIHPEPTGYDELRDRFLAYARAVREVHPTARITGPVSANVWFYYNLASGDEDRAAHGQRPVVPWFLSEVKKHDDEWGRRTLDVLDVHFYPDIGGGDGLQATRLLWDPAYAGPDGTRLALIPRLKDWVARNYPGTGIGITEYRFQAGGGVADAVALVDALGIFGREGVEVAATWDRIEPGSPQFHAFRVFGDYDGEGGRFGELSVPAESDEPAAISAYAALRGPEETLTLLLLNKDRVRTLRSDLWIWGYPRRGPLKGYRYDGTDPTAIAPLVPLNFERFRVQVDLPPVSVTVLEFP